MIWGHFDPCHPSPVCMGGSKMADFEVKIRSQWQGHPGTLESTWKLLNVSNHIYINGKTWYRAALTPATLPVWARGDQKWLILRSKSGHNGRVKQGAWNQRGNSLSPRITSILIGKHDLGPLWPLPSFSHVHRGSKMAYFGVKVRSQWQGYWNQSGNSLTPYIKPLLIGKHCLGYSIHLLYLCAQREGKK